MGYRHSIIAKVTLLTQVAFMTSAIAWAEESSTSSVQPTNNTQTGEKVTSSQAAPDRDSLASEIKAKIDSDLQSKDQPAAPAAAASTANATDQKSWFTRNFGMNYNSFFSGPGFDGDFGKPRGLLGTASDTGLNFFNLISVKYKFSKDIAFDVQFRNQLVINHDDPKNPQEGPIQYRHQGQRFGISGKLLKGKDWVVAGAVNSDLPIRQIMGQIPSDRTLIANPGFFGTFSYDPSGSKWSVFALLAPRVWFYRDRNAVAIQDVTSCGNDCDPRTQKPEIALLANPSINYAASEKVGIRLGTTLQYSKNVGTKLLRDFMPMELGVTYDVSPALSIYTYVVTATPLDDSVRRDLYGITTAMPWYKTASINVWLSGTVF